MSDKVIKGLFLCFMVVSALFLGYVWSNTTIPYSRSNVFEDLPEYPKWKEERSRTLPSAEGVKQ
jgi:hypothetical protein